MRQVSLTVGDGAGRTDALIDIDLDVACGELVAVTGRSGSGKSSLLNVAGGLVPATGGHVRVVDADLIGLSARELAAAWADRVVHLRDGRIDSVSERGPADHTLSDLTELITPSDEISEEVL